MIGLFVVVNLGVFSRYLFQDAFTWTEELALFLLSWMVFLAGSMAIRKWENVRVTYFLEKLPPFVASVIEGLMKILVLAFLVYIFILAAKIIPEVAPTEMLPALNISMMLPQMSIVVGIAFMAVQSFGVILETMADYRKKGAR